jgi:hypothetical protein
MTSRFILDKFDLDLPSARLLVRFGFLVLFVVVAGTVNRVVVVDERVITNRGWSAGWWMGVSGCGVTGMHIESALTFSHSWRCGRDWGVWRGRRSLFGLKR